MVVVLQGKSERMTVAAKTERNVEIRDRVAVKTETKMEIRKGVVVKTVRTVEVRDRVLVKTEKQVQVWDRAEKKLDVLAPAKSKPKPESDNKKIKAATVVLKVELRCPCQAHMDKIRKTMKDIKGVEKVAVDAERNLVTVQGTMDGKALPAIFEAKLNWKAEVVEPKKEKMMK